MPTHRQLTVEVPVTTRKNGSSETKNLQDAFPGSPIHKGELTDDVIRSQGQTLLTDGTVNDGGHTFGEFNLDYVDAPNLEDVEVGGAGMPGSPYAPNIASPPEGMNPSDIPAEGVAATENAKGSGGPFSGDALASPSKTSLVTSKQKIGSLIFGKSETRE
jgi:hypothetical protein